MAPTAKTRRQSFFPLLTLPCAAVGALAAIVAVSLAGSRAPPAAAWAAPILSVAPAASETRSEPLLCSTQVRAFSPLVTNQRITRGSTRVEVIEAGSPEGRALAGSPHHDLADGWAFETLEFDSDGLGCGVRGIATAINDERTAAERRAILTDPYRGSGPPHDPEAR